MVRHLLVSMLAATVLFFGCDSTEPPGPVAPVTGNTGNTGQDMENLLEELRKGQVPESPDIEGLKAWLEKSFVKGKTSRDEVESALGTYYRNPDRPGFNDVITFEYFLGPPESVGTWHHLILDFKANSGVLLDWRIETTTYEEE